MANVNCVSVCVQLSTIGLKMLNKSRIFQLKWKMAAGGENLTIWVKHIFLRLFSSFYQILNRHRHLFPVYLLHFVCVRRDQFKLQLKCKVERNSIVYLSSNSLNDFDSSESSLFLLLFSLSKEWCEFSGVERKSKSEEQNQTETSNFDLISICLFIFEFHLKLNIL